MASPAAAGPLPPVLSGPEGARVASFQRRWGEFFTDEGAEIGMAFKPQPDDILIATPFKCGTTWTCQMVQSLRSRGDMSFDEINMVMPCLEMAHDSGYGDLDKPQGGLRRVFKTHFAEEDCPRGFGKTIYVCRDPFDAMPSFYHYMNGWVFQRDVIGLEAYVTQVELAKSKPAKAGAIAGVTYHIASWFPRRADPDVLWLHYEDLAEDLPAAIRLIAEFLGIGADDPELQALAVQQASLESMKAHPTKYDEHVLKHMRHEAVGLSKTDGADNAKVREGGVGKNKAQLSEAARAAIQRQWEEVAKPLTGYASYDEMRRAINRQLGRPFAQ